jgi:uncharacterized protein YgbK (DUF1537 family)
MIGVVADDTTGANDIGVMFAKHGWLTAVVAHDSPNPLPQVDALILDTDSRLDPRGLAYEKVFAATRRLRALRCVWLHKKTCSVFRGNIGAEFDAMLDATGDEFAVISLAFPKNGRETREGIHTVHGVRLAESPFAHDPVHPMSDSNLAAILSQQTRRRIALVPLGIVRQGSTALRQVLEDERRLGGYAIVDAVEQRDLATLAAAAYDFAVFGGSSAIGEELPRCWPQPPQRDPLEGRELDDPHGVLIIAGSLTPETRAQTTALVDRGVPAVVLDSRRLFEPRDRQREISRATAEALVSLRAGRDTLVLAPQIQSIVDETKARGAAAGLDPLTTSKTVSASLAEIASAVVDATQLKRLVVAGGDTSGTICRRLGIWGNYVLKEIATGVPSGLALGRDMVVVLKSGSFGAPDFLGVAVDHLKTFAKKGRVTV